MTQTLKAIRFNNNLTQYQLGIKAGICQPRISLIETGQHVPSADEIQRISRALELSAGEIDWPDVEMREEALPQCREASFS